MQLTWRNNYEKYGQMLNVDLVSNPDRAMEPNQIGPAIASLKERSVALRRYL